MNIKLQRNQTLFISLFCAILFGVVALLVSDNKFTGFDNTIIAFIQGLESPILTSVMKFFTFIGSEIPVAVLALIIVLLLFRFLQSRRELILFAGVIIGSTILNQTLKIIFHRLRPAIHRLAEASGYSFPSGHAMAAFSLYGVTAFLLWRHINSSFGRIMVIVFSVTMILAIGISRIYLGVHYPSDVLGGYLASGFWLIACIWVYQSYEKKKDETEDIAI